MSNLSIEKTFDLLDRIIKKSDTKDIEIGLIAKEENSIRFAENSIHQCMSNQDFSIMIRIALDQKIGCTAINQLDSDSIKWAINKAIENARASKPNFYFSGFVKKTEILPVPQPYYESTATAKPKDLINKAHKLIQNVEKKDYEAAGTVSTEIYTTALMTSSDHFAYQTETRSSALTVVNRSGQAGFGTGYSEINHRDLNLVDTEKLAREAKRISEMNTNPQPFLMTECQAVLSPIAMSTLYFYLAWMSFHATVIETNQSFIANRFGQKVLDSQISIWENAHDPRNFGRAFDWEGTPTQRTDIITFGNANDVVYDRITAKKAGRSSSGNALGQDRDIYYASPMTENLIVKNGNTTIEEMIKNTGYGIFVNRLWYVREFNFKDASVTGMTRDGTFLIKNGRIKHALPNLRFSVSLVDLFSSVQSIGDKLHLSKIPVGTVLSPAMKLDNFYITGSSTY